MPHRGVFLLWPASPRNPGSSTVSDAAEKYILATGGPGAHRLRLLHEAYGPGTAAMLQRAGLRTGQRVVELGCGTGNIACWVAEQVGPEGLVVGIDLSPEQIAEARRLAESRGLTNLEFRVADAYDPRLPAATFDLAYCRVVLSHLAEPGVALRAMQALVKPGGVVACEELDLGTWLCEPPSAAMTQFVEWMGGLGAQHGANFRLGVELHRLMSSAGLSVSGVGANYPLVLQGEVKRLLWLTLNEFAPELVRAGLASQEHVDRVAAEMLTLADDDTTLVGLLLLVQVWAIQPSNR